MKQIPPTLNLAIWSLAALPLATGCAAVPDLGERAQPRSVATIDVGQSLSPVTDAAWPDQDWWSGFGDPQLSGLIAEGLSNSPDLAAAAARFRKASALAQQAGAARLPTLDATASATVEKQSYNNGFPKEFLPRGWRDNGEIAGVAGFDLDLWGRNRALLAAATSEEDAASFEMAEARIMLATGIAAAYADFQRLNDQRSVSTAAVAMRRESERIVSARWESGLDTLASRRLAQAQTATAQAELAAVEQQLALRRNQIALLVGAGPDRGLALDAPRLAEVAGLGLPQGVTTDLVARRPDVAATLARVRAAASRIEVARADFFPAIRLEALVGLQSLGMDNLFSSDSKFGRAGPAISLPLFHGGELRGRYRGARADYDLAVADYDKTVLSAYGDVADAVSVRQSIARRLVEARAALDASESAYSIAQLRYKGGLSTYLDVLAVEDRLLQARRAVSEIEGAARAADVSLIRALGGGFGTVDETAGAHGGNADHG